MSDKIVEAQKVRVELVRDARCARAGDAHARGRASRRWMGGNEP